VNDKHITTSTASPILHNGIRIVAPAFFLLLTYTTSIFGNFGGLVSNLVKNGYFLSVRHSVKGLPYVMCAPDLYLEQHWEYIYNLNQFFSLLTFYLHYVYVFIFHFNYLIYTYLPLRFLAEFSATSSTFIQFWKTLITKFMTAY